MMEMRAHYCSALIVEHLCVGKRTFFNWVTWTVVLRGITYGKHVVE